MSPNMTSSYTSKTQLYQKVKKPLLERQRRARINKCLDALKHMMADLQHDDAILSMDKAEMLEKTIVYMRQEQQQRQHKLQMQLTPPTMDSFRNGYMNAVNEVSRVLASTPGMNVEMGKSVMSHLGRVYQRLQQQQQQPQQQQAQNMQALSIVCSSAATSAQLSSPASSGYHSDDYESPAASPVAAKESIVWRPW